MSSARMQPADQMSTEAPYGSGENYRPLVRRFAATVDADTRPENEGEEGSPIKHWAAAGYSGSH